MTAWVRDSRWRWYLAVLSVLCLVAGAAGAFTALRPTSAEWTDPVYARGDVVIGTWPIFTPVDAVSAGHHYTCLTIDGQAWCSGESSSDVPKTGQTGPTNTMTLVQPGARGTNLISHLDTGYNHTCVVASGAAYCWGPGGGGLGNYDPMQPWNTPGSVDPVAVYAEDADPADTVPYRSPLYQQTVTRVFVGEEIGCALMATGRAACWGLYTYLTRPNSGPEQYVVAPILVPTTSEDPASQMPDGTVIEGIDTEFQNACALTGAGDLYCWGRNDQGQLGLPDNADVEAPRLLPRGASGSGPITYVGLGNFQLCFISGGSAYCSGSRSGGALGDGLNSPNATEPVAVDDSGVLAGVTLIKVVGGGSFNCALSDAGRAYCWGLNDLGQLGNNGTTNALVPVAVDTSQMPAGVTFTDIDAGTAHMCGRGSDGNVYCWGQGASGEQATGSNPATVLRPETPMTDTWTAP